MEILGYCLLFWASGTLPWSSQTNKLLVAKAKKRCVRGRQECNRSMTSCFFLSFQLPTRCLSFGQELLSRQRPRLSYGLHECNLPAGLLGEARVRDIKKNIF